MPEMCPEGIHVIEKRKVTTVPSLFHPVTLISRIKLTFCDFRFSYQVASLF